MFFNLNDVLVRPHSEYASTVLSFIYKKYCIPIGSVQRSYGFQGMNNTDIVKELMPPSLQCRISRADRVEVLKIIKEIAKCGKIKLFTIQHAS